VTQHLEEEIVLTHRHEITAQITKGIPQLIFQVNVHGRLGHEKKEKPDRGYLVHHSRGHTMLARKHMKRKAAAKHLIHSL